MTTENKMYFFKLSLNSANNNVAFWNEMKSSHFRIIENFITYCKSVIENFPPFLFWLKAKNY